MTVAEHLFTTYLPNSTGNAAFFDRCPRPGVVTVTREFRLHCLEPRRSAQDKTIGLFTRLMGIVLPSRSKCGVVDGNDLTKGRVENVADLADIGLFGYRARMSQKHVRRPARSIYR